MFHCSVYGAFVSLCFTAQCMGLCLSVCVSLLSVWGCVCQSVFHCSVYGVVFVSLCFTAQCMGLCLSVSVSLLGVWCCISQLSVWFCVCLSVFHCLAYGVVFVCFFFLMIHLFRMPKLVHPLLNNALRFESTRKSQLSELLEPFAVVFVLVCGFLVML